MSPQGRVGSGLIPLRAVVGLAFLMHGGQKLFVYGPSGAGAAFASMGIPLPQLSALVVTAVELLGGIALVLGLFTRLAGLLLAIDMTVAILAVRIKGGYFAPGGCEYELALWAAGLTFVALGAGGASLDSVLRRRRA
jgi:putative oxidoreductase